MRNYPCGITPVVDPPCLNGLFMHGVGVGEQFLCTRPCGLMDKALVFGTKDCRFESCQGHLRTEIFKRSCDFDIAHVANISFRNRAWKRRSLPRCAISTDPW